MKIPNFKHGSLDEDLASGQEGLEMDPAEMHSPFNVEHTNVMQKVTSHTRNVNKKLYKNNVQKEVITLFTG